VLALVHHAADPFTATQVVTDSLSPSERKAAHKNLKVVQFTGTLPAAGEPPVVLPVQINGVGRRVTSTTLVIAFKGYRGRVHVWLPQLPNGESLIDAIDGAKPADFKDAHAWAEQHMAEILRNQDSDHPYDRDWSKQRIEDVQALLESGLMVVGESRRGRITIKNLELKPGTRATIFLFFDRRGDLKPGAWFPVEIMQLDTKTGRVRGGLSTRVEIVPKPRTRRRVAVPRQRPASLDLPELVESP
jgi:hypothetical protein